MYREREEEKALNIFFKKKSNCAVGTSTGYKYDTLQISQKATVKN